MSSIALGFVILTSLLVIGSAEPSSSDGHASVPPRGWNSYDAFSWIISEEQFLQNADVVSKKLLAHGYKYVVVDYLWYRRKVEGAYSNSLGFDVIDTWGRPLPDPQRWPSSRGGKGFKNVADAVHKMGLKFGIHVMRGISTQAVNANTPILDVITGGQYNDSERHWQAKDIGLKERACPWMSQGFMAVDTDKGAGRAFLRSLYHQYAEWGVDFVKHDCIFGDDLDTSEILIVSEALQRISRPIVYSLSPGTHVTPAMAAKISSRVNMYRITGDDWDAWEHIKGHFNISRDFASSHLIGAEGLKGKSWPDMDMLPFGQLTDVGSNEGPHRKCNLTIDEQRTQVTLWSMFKSPLMFGGDLTQIDQTTLGLITSPTLLEINSYSGNNMEYPFVHAKSPHCENVQITRPVVPVDENEDVNNDLQLTSCSNVRARGFILEAYNGDIDHICWKEGIAGENISRFCLYKRQPLLTEEEQIAYERRYSGKFHLVTAASDDLCLDSSIDRRNSMEKSAFMKFSPCRYSANQLWDYVDGKLVDSYYGLCATKHILDDTKYEGEVRSWIATGRKGEIYLSFFNLFSCKMTISTTIKELAKVLPKDYIRKGSCYCSEIWTNQQLGIIRKELSMEVAAHGCAAFVLKCH
ncbi:uncharacterized protein LOC116249641 [Nymphaea colorata]|nr:uncharacterized protein LOC116249641 [Nymphaea colorata]